MPRKKSKKEEPQIEVSELELELAEKKKENEQLKAVIEEREKLLKKYEELEAKERLMKINKMKESGELEVEDTSDEEEDKEIDFSEIVKDIKPSISDIPQTTKKDEFEKLLEQFNEQNKGTLEVYRIDGGRQIKIGRFSVRDIGSDLDSIARKFGGGEYRLRLRNPDGTFAGEITEYYDEIAYPRPTMNNNFIPMYNPSQNSDISAILTSIYQMNKENQLMIMNLMTKMVESIGQRNQFINSIKDIVEIKELVSPKVKEENPVKSIDTLINVLLKGIELGKMNNEGGESDVSIIMDLVKSVIPVLTAKSIPKPTIEQVMKEVKDKVENQVKQVEQVNEIKQIEQKPVNSGGIDMSNNIILKMYKPYIIEFAKSNKNPKDVAMVIFSKIPEQYLPICYDFILYPDRFTEIVKWIPELKDYKEWVDKVLEEGKKLIEDYFKEIEK